MPPPPPKTRSTQIIVGIILVSILACAVVTLFVVVNLRRRNQAINNPSTNIPSQYYVGAPRKYMDGQGLGVLQNDVARVTWSVPYQEDVFDCSEMSAYMERSLENAGWHTVICVTSSNWNGKPHAWVLVEAAPGGWTPVECTIPSVVWGDDLHYHDYFTFDHEFETIHEAIAYAPSEFDWWKNIQP